MKKFLVLLCALFMFCACGGWAFALPLSQIVAEIETGKQKNLTYKPRPVLSTKDTKILFTGMKRVKDAGKMQGVAPETVDLRSSDTPVKDQGSEGLCTAFATVASVEFLIKQAGTVYDLSERHLWSNYKQYYTTKALSAAQKYWITSETIWPYAKAKSVSTIKPLGKITSYVEVTTLEEVYAALRAKNAVVLSATTNTSWSNPQNGILSTIGRAQGGHAIKVSGYFDTSKGRYLIIKNSWGSDYGDKGWVYLPVPSYCNKFFCGFHVVTKADKK
jgi:C1A family cysteine protease